MDQPRPAVTRGQALHLQVANYIRGQIESGRLRDGELLPSTRELAATWDVSVFTISEAMKVLTAEGWVVNKDRSGRQVRLPGGRSVNLPDRLGTQSVLVGGYPGSGKSELGRVIARETGWAVVDKDTLTRPLAEQLLQQLGESPHDRESQTYLDRVRPFEYETLMAVAKENAECGTSAILNAPFLREFTSPAWIEATCAELGEAGATPIFVWVHCDVETMWGYMTQRGAPRDASKLRDWHGYAAGLNFEFRPPVDHFLVDNSATSVSLQKQVYDLLDYIKVRDAQSRKTR